MGRAADALEVSDGQREVLDALARSQTLPFRVVTRARVLLLAADGLSNVEIAEVAGVSRPTVLAWRADFAGRGLVDFGEVRSGRGRKLSTAKRFEEKLVDVVGLYLHPPDKAVVLCADEKSQIQALDRTKPSLPMKKGRAGTMTHDYKRNGTTTLFAALNYLDGTVIGRCLPRHRNGEFLKFLRVLDRDFPRSLDLHLIVDNYGTHTHPNVKAWLEKHPRFHLHFTPTSSSWLNLVERWFRELTQKAIRRGVFPSVPALIEAIQAYLDAYNEDPKPFVWTATVESIVEKVNRCKAILQAAH